MSKIIHWTIKITWSDGEEEYLSDIPDAIAKPTDDYLDGVESQRNEEEEIKNNKMELSGNSNV